MSDERTEGRAEDRNAPRATSDRATPREARTPSRIWSWSASAPFRIATLAVALAAVAYVGYVVWMNWVDDDEPAVAVAGGDIARGEDALRSYGCIACHSVPGVEGPDTYVGPPLTAWAERRYIAGSLVNTPDNLIYWIQYPQAVEPGTAMPTLAVSTEDARDIAAYLFALEAP